MSADDWERKVAAPQTQCAACSTKFEPGDVYVAALIVREGKLERDDRCEACAEAADKSDAPPLGVWKAKVAAPTGPMIKRLDFETLSELLPRLEGKDDEASRRLAWIVTLLLLRKKLLVTESKTVVDGAELLTVKFKHDDRLFRIRDPQMDDAALARLHEELAAVFDLGPAPGAAPNGART